MPVKIGQNGTPTASLVGLTGERHSMVTELITPQPVETSFSQVLADVLAGFNDNAVVIINPNTRKIYAAGGLNGETLVDIVNQNAPAPTQVVLTPTEGQSGVSLEFGAVKGVGSAQSVKDIADMITTPVKPRRSAASIISLALSQTFEEGKAPLIMVNQAGKNVVLVELANGSAEDIDEAIEDAKGTGTEAVVIALSGDDESVENATVKLAFEGGIV